MNKQNKYQTVNNLQNISEEMKDKGYQLEGVFFQNLPQGCQQNTLHLLEKH